MSKNMIQKNIILLVWIVLCSVFIVIAEGVTINIFTLWNLVPIVICYYLFRLAIKENRVALYGGAIGYTLLGVGLLLFIHAAWYFDLDGTSTGASTGGLIFIFIPICSCAFGGIGYGIGFFIGRLFTRHA